MRSTLVIFTLSLLLASPAIAEDDASQVAFVLVISRPATAQSVEAARAHVDAGAADELALVRALGAAGGAESTKALARLLGHRSSDVRIAALTALKHVALRSEKSVAGIREAVTGSFRSQTERLAGIAALGAIGDGRDMPLLLALAAGPEEERLVRTAAFRAMASLSGATIPFVHARWAYWWRLRHKRATKSLSSALAVLDETGAAASAAGQAELLARDGWTDLKRVRTALAGWLRSSVRGRRVAACQIVAELRLADLTPQVAAIARGAMVRPDEQKAAVHALSILGVSAVERAR